MARTIYRIDLKQLQENFTAIRRAAGSCQLMPVLKADAYGMDAHTIGSTLKSAGAARFAGATLDEALDLQKLGLPVQILGLLPENEIAETVRAGIIAPVANLATAQKLSAEACRQNTTVKIESRGITLFVTVMDGKVDVYKSDCPDGVCVNSAPISKTGETIICAPAGVSITVKGGDGDVDFVAG